MTVEKEYIAEMSESPSIRSVFDVDGLCCHSEARLIEEKLSAQQGLVNLSVNIPAGTLTTVHQAELLSAERIAEVLNHAGLKARVRASRMDVAKPDASPYKSPKFLTMAGGALSVFLAVLLQYGLGFFSAAIVFYLAAIVMGGYFVFQNAWSALRHHRLDISVLMTIAVIGAMAIGEWLEASTVIVLFALAEWLEGMSMVRARRAITELMELAPPVASVKQNGQLVEVPVENVAVTDIVVVRPGGQIPVDGVIVEGKSDINEAAITGESIPLWKKPGAQVYAGSINGRGSLDIRVTKSADESTLAHIVDAIEEARSNQSRTERFVDRFAHYYTPAVVVIAALIALVPPLFFGGLWDDWFYRALVLLVIACPCALVISTPIATVAGLARAARHGILVKGGRYLEALGRIRAVAFDKTGTLTTGKPAVSLVEPVQGVSENELLYFAALAELRSEHHIARAIVAKAHQQKIYPESEHIEHFLAEIGEGVEIKVKEAPATHEAASEFSPALQSAKTVRVGMLSFFQRIGVNLTPENVARWQALEDTGQTIVGVAAANQFLGFLAVTDTPRAEASQAISTLRTQQIQCFVLTGDNPKSAQHIAGKIGLDSIQENIFASLMPTQKVEHVERLSNKYQHIAMVGDGVNDAPALAAATVGVAMGAAGTDVALETADVALMADDLLKLPEAIKVGKQTLRIIKQNIIFAIGLKALFLALAAAGVATLWMAIVADMGASLVVILNGLRLLSKERNAPESNGAHPAVLKADLSS